MVYYISAALAVVALYYIATSIQAYLRLRAFKGPWIAGFSDLWYLRANISGRCHEYLADACVKYASVTRIGPNTLVTDDEDFARRINTVRSGYSKSDWYKGFRFGADIENVFSETDSERHNYLRKRLALGMSGKNNPNLEAEIDAVIFSLFDVWREKYVSKDGISRPMDLAQKIQFFTLDVIAALMYSKPLGWVSSDSDLFEYNEIMSNNFPYMFFLSAVPLISNFLRIPWVDKLLAPKASDRIGLGKIKGVSLDILSTRFNHENDHQDKQDMTTAFMANKLTKGEIADTILLVILAGSDTTATTIRSGLSCIIAQPRVLRTLQQECDAAGMPKNEIISYARSLRLPYLQACIKESLRFWPVATGLASRVVPPNGDYYNGKFIPGGTVIGQCVWNRLKRNKIAYGEDANVFRPDRWIDATREAEAGHPERLQRMEKAQELVFGYGEFGCLGSRIAGIEMSKIFFEIIRRFELGFVDGLITVEKNWNCGLFIQEGMWVTVDER